MKDQQELQSSTQRYNKQNVVNIKHAYSRSDINSPKDKAVLYGKNDRLSKNISFLGKKMDNINKVMKTIDKEIKKMKRNNSIVIQNTSNDILADRKQNFAKTRKERSPITSMPNTSSSNIERNIVAAKINNISKDKLETAFELKSKKMNPYSLMGMTSKEPKKSSNTGLSQRKDYSKTVDYSFSNYIDGQNHSDFKFKDPAIRSNSKTGLDNDITHTVKRLN